MACIDFNSGPHTNYHDHIKKLTASSKSEHDWQIPALKIVELRE